METAADEPRAHLAPHTLYVVATPIGNLGDLSPRAVKVLGSVDAVYAEDTRSFARLAQRFSLSASVRSCHEHNERAIIDSALAELASGKSLALVSDAGTPLISDPGYRLVAACRAAGHPVVAVPGPCAAIAALSISGLEPDRFRFEGFVPPKTGKRKQALQAALDSDCTTIFYESPHRILKTLQQLCDLEANREIAVARELTKIHEEVLTGPVSAVFSQLQDRPAIKGEFVLLVRRAEKKKRQPSDD